MRSLGLLTCRFLFTSALYTTALLAPTVLFAQHATMPSPPPASHVTAPSATHTGASSPHVSAPHGTASTSHSAAQTSHLASAKASEAQISGAKPAPEKRGWFSWLRKHEPVNPDSHKRGKERRNPGTNYVAQQFPPYNFYAKHGCTVVPVSNPGVPCNPFAPCCD
jgi:membrane-bound lytic murein transglycosylase B